MVDKIMTIVNQCCKEKLKYLSNDPAENRLKNGVATKQKKRPTPVLPKAAAKKTRKVTGKGYVSVSSGAAASTLMSTSSQPSTSPIPHAAAACGHAAEAHESSEQDEARGTETESQFEPPAPRFRQNFNFAA